MSAEPGNGRPWPPLEELHSDEAKLIRLALDSLGEQQLEILGSIEGVNLKVGNNTQQIKDSEQQIRGEQRAEFKLVRQQFGAINKTLDTFGTEIGTVRAVVEDVRSRVDSLGKLLGSLRLSDRSITSDSGSIPPPLTLDSHFDFERTPMGGIKLDQKAQAVLAQRMAKLEEERRVADAIAADRAATIAAQKKEAAEKAEADRLAGVAQAETDLKKSAERRNWLAAIVAACLAAGGGIHWLVQALTHH